VAILLGRYPNSARQFDPGGVLGVLNAVLYGTIGLLGAEIPIAAGIIIGIGSVAMSVGDDLLWHFARLRGGGRRAPPGPVDRTDRLETQRWHANARRGLCPDRACVP
jgi:hypothetical protein